MAKGKRKWWLLFSLLLFTIFLFAAPQRIREETVLGSRWITALEAESSDEPSASLMPGVELVPFILGERFGYIGSNGRFAINQMRNVYVSMSETYWAQYDPLPFNIQIMNKQNESVFVIEQPLGYPVFLDNRIFIVGSEQNSISALGPDGTELWSYYFPSPLTCIDAAGGYFLGGSLDGVVTLLNRMGSPAFIPFEPGGSNMSVILGCAISQDASRLALISGINEQRFLLMERAGDNYRVVYHEFLGSGFRRPVHINFVDNDSKVVFEREGGLGIYSIGSRRSININLEGEIVTMDDSGEDGFLFLITSQGSNEKSLVTIKYPGLIVSKAPFRSYNTFFARRDTRLYLGGDTTIAMLELQRH